MVKSLLQNLLGSAGYEVRRKPLPADPSDAQPLALEREAGQQIQIVREHTMLPYSRLLTLYEQAVYCEVTGLTGSFVECGTWKGGAVGLMALANLRHGRVRRQIHLFDSFEGIPEPDEAVDGMKAVREIKQAGGGTKGLLAPVAGLYESVGTLQVNRDLLERIIGYPTDCLHYHPGWFQETLPREGHEVGPIAILRLDGDWYASTKICLDALFGNVVRGGFVIIDDYGRYEGCRKAVDEFMQREDINVFLHRIDSEGRYLIKP